MTFDSLGEQTSKVAAMGPALENAQQINVYVFFMSLEIYLSDSWVISLASDGKYSIKTKGRSRKLTKLKVCCFYTYNQWFT